MRILSSAVILVLLLGSCGLKGDIYTPKDPSRCLGCSVDTWFRAVKKEKSKAVKKEKSKAVKKEKSKLEGQEEPLDKKQFKYIPKVKGQKN